MLGLLHSALVPQPMLVSVPWLSGDGGGNLQRPAADALILLVQLAMPESINSNRAVLSWEYMP
jgi:hypothetical protein